MRKYRTFPPTRTEFRELCDDLAASDATILGLQAERDALALQHEMLVGAVAEALIMLGPPHAADLGYPFHCGTDWTRWPCDNEDMRRLLSPFATPADPPTAVAVVSGRDEEVQALSLPEVRPYNGHDVADLDKWRNTVIDPRTLPLVQNGETWIRNHDGAEVVIVSTDSYTVRYRHRSGSEFNSPLAVFVDYYTLLTLDADEQMAQDAARDLDRISEILRTQGKAAGKEAVDEINAKRRASMEAHPCVQDMTAEERWDAINGSWVGEH